MTDAPVVTVGLPVYNDPEGLWRSVPTVLSQTFPGTVRLLVVDDGSTDRTPEVLQELSRLHPGRIDVLRNATNQGRPAARNRILSECGDGYLAWIDADDLWHPRKLELQYAALQERLQITDRPVLCTCTFRWAFADAEQVVTKIPKLKGDQLHHVLTGRLYPYLWTMLGEAQAFRDAGGFDVELPRRQDYEFLVRFTAQGGKVIKADGDEPLCTYVKSDAGRSSREVARSNRAIRRKHRGLYLRYGRRFYWHSLQRQSLLVARFAAGNHEPIRQVVHRSRAACYGALQAATRFEPVRQLARVGRYPRTVAGRLRRGEPLRAAIAGPERGRDAGAADATDGTGADRAVTQLLATVRDDLARRDRDAAITRLEQHLATADDGGHPDAWLLLVSAYRRADRLRSARVAMDRALERHPDHRELRLRSVELYSLQRAWQDCVTAWEELGDLRAVAEEETYFRVARALRMLEDDAAALEVAAAGLERWPEGSGLNHEFRRARAVVLDWSKCVVPVPTGIVPTAASAGGAVTSLGFLMSDGDRMTGWLDLEPGGTPQVTLAVNGKDVATTSAAATDPADVRRHTFSFNCQSLAEYLGDGDVVSFRHAGREIPIEGMGSRCVLACGHPTRFEELAARVDAGHAFTKFGDLRPRFDLPTRRSILALFEDVAALVDERTGRTCYPFYGNLLGAIREHDFIGHDIGGFDMGYVSAQHGPEAVRAEIVGLCEVLLAAGYHLTLDPWSVMIRERSTQQTFVDLNYGWFDDRDELNLSFGWRYPPVRRDELLLDAPRTSIMAGVPVPVPGNAEAMLEQIYGPGWRVPDQGFDLQRDLRRDTRYLLSADQIHALGDAHPDRVRVRSLPEDHLA